MFFQACFHGHGTLLGVVWKIHAQAIVGVKVMYMYDPKVMVSQVVQEMWFQTGSKELLRHECVKG